jgi:organic hydroperoxide reductase OsmC/OhrA
VLRLVPTSRIVNVRIHEGCADEESFTYGRGERRYPLMTSMTQPYPHTYTATASAEPTGSVTVASPRLEPLRTAPPAEFGGPGNLWSPETLLVASIANCFVLTLRALTRAAGFRWLSVECHVEGVLERVEGVTQFSRFVTHAKLSVRNGTDEAVARQLLERAENGCLIGNSLRGARRLEATIVVPDPAVAVAVAS